MVTGQLADTPTRGLPTRGLDDSRIGHLADWSTRGCNRRLCVLSFPVWRHLRDHELSSTRLVQSASWQSASWRIRELSSYPTNSRCVLYIKAGAVNMAGAWYIHRRCGRCGWCVVYTDRRIRPIRAELSMH